MVKCLVYIIIIMLISADAQAWESRDLSTKLEGAYFNEHEIVSIKKDQQLKGTDTLEVMNIDNNTIYFNSRLVFVQGNTCQISGIAKLKGGQFVYEKTTDNNGKCSLTLEFDDKTIKLLDYYDRCKEYCSPRAYIHGATFNYKTRMFVDRRKIYDSKEYKETVKNPFKLIKQVNY